MELRKVHPETMSATQFGEATAYWARDAANLLRDMTEWGLVQVETRMQGPIPVREISLTPAGVVAADLALKVEEATNAAKTAAQRQKERD